VTDLSGAFRVFSNIEVKWLASLAMEDEEEESLISHRAAEAPRAILDTCNVLIN
jgi:hypothetical protein